jgi:serine/threonine-protein kinase
MRWAEIDALLDGVLDQPTHLREAWLQEHGGDPELRGLVRTLLDVDAVRGARIESHAAAARNWLDAGACALPEIPGYRLLQLIGEGGMASVFRAERVLGHTVQRVALKRLRINVYDRDERRRFEHEHHILARLEHPNIARLVDAGIAADGVPWFAMEYVEGEPAIAWCDARKLDSGARLALFADICAAAHYAHQHLVVHRDLKPSNILVGEDGRVKLLDFGIARLLEPDAGGGDGTCTGQRRLTPGYAAPEQYSGQASTATDVYALGVILVELLSGQRPATGREPDSDPLRGLTVTGAHADARSSTPRALQRLLSGDLSAIARKAMRSDPALRYGSVQALGEDLASLRAGRPVAARRGDWRYRASCFVRRNKVAVAASVLIAGTLVTATGISLEQARRANAQADRAQAVQAFVEDMLAPLREGVPSARMPKLDEMLATGIRELDRTGRRDPAVYSDLLVMFARTYDRMGDIETARTLAQRAYLHSAKAFGADDPRTVQALAMRGRMHARFGDREQARKDLEAARTQMHRNGIDGAALAMVLDDLGFLQLDFEDRERASQAMALFALAQQQRQQELGARHPDLAIGYANMADAQSALANRLEALKLYQKAYRHCATYEGPETRQAAIYLSRTGLTKCQLGRWRDGSQDYISALGIFDRLDQKDHPERFRILDGGCTAWTFLDELAQAQSDCDQAMNMALRLYGPESGLYRTARRHRIRLLAAQGRLQEARAEAESMRSTPGDDHFQSAYLAGLASDAQRIEGDYVGMREGLLGFVLAGSYSDWPIKPGFTARLALACAHVPAPACPQDLVAKVDADMAEPFFRRHPLRIEALLPLAQLALKQGDIALAHARLDDIAFLAALPHARLSSTHRWLAEARMLRGEALAAQGDPAGARREWRAAEAVFAARYPVDHPFRRQVSARLRQVATR